MKVQRENGALLVLNTHAIYLISYTIRLRHTWNMMGREKGGTRHNQTTSRQIFKKIPFPRRLIVGWQQNIREWTKKCCWITTIKEKRTIIMVWITAQDMSASNSLGKHIFIFYFGLEFSNDKFSKGKWRQRPPGSQFDLLTFTHNSREQHNRTYSYEY